MSTSLSPEPTLPPGPGTKTLCVKNVPHAVWQRARQNALASNLSFADYVVRLLGIAGPFPPSEQSVWESLLGASSESHSSSLTPTATSKVSG